MGEFLDHRVFCRWVTKLGRGQNEILERLTETYGSPENVWELKRKEELSEEILSSEKLSDRILDPALKEEAAAEIAKADKNGIGVMTVLDEIYPTRLKNCRQRPILLYYLGEPEKLRGCSRTLGVVGSRNATVYGKETTRRLLSDLQGEDVAVISGMARGIDSVAHRTALEKGMFTVAVLGCGVNVVYPAENVGLYRGIREKGLLLSEQPVDEKPFKSFFPARNRIIAGLSDSVLVTEAGLSSGSLITVDYALDLGRDVLSVPHRIDCVTVGGCNNLIKNGAVCVTSSADLFDSLGLERRENITDSWIDTLKDEEKKVYVCIKDGISDFEDGISEATGLESKTVKRVLTSLEVNGFIRDLGNCYVTV